MPAVTIELDENTTDSESPDESASPRLVSKSFLLSLIDPRELVFPFSLRRLFFWLIYIGLVIGLFFLDREIHWFQAFTDFVTANNIIVTAVLLFTEPTVTLLQMLLTHYPSLQLATESSPQNSADSNTADDHVAIEMEIQPDNVATATNNQQLALIIPCHNSAKFITKTIKAALLHFAPQQIFIMDNGRASSPTDNTEEIVKAINPAINYNFLANTGNKTVALFYGAQYAKSHYQYALTIDDDVLIPPYFRFRQALFANDAEVCGIVYPVLATADGHAPTLVCRWQNLEYLLADLEFHFLDKTRSVLRPHGAVSLWDISTLIKILLKHNTHFKGEDIMEGRIVHEMHWRSQAKRLRLDKRCPFATVVPQAYFWPQANLYTQRVRSWKEAQFLYCWDLNIRPLLTIWHSNPLSTLSIKWSQLYNCYSQFLHVVRYPIIAVAASEPSFWVILAISIGLQQGVAWLFNRFKAQPEVRNDLVSVLTYPIYKQLDNLMGTLGALRTLLISMPAKSDSCTLKEQLRRKADTWPPLPEASDSSSSSDDDEGVANHAAASSSLPANHIRFFKTQTVRIQPPAPQLSTP